MDLPPDPFAEDPDDPAKILGSLDEGPDEPISADERAELLADLDDLDLYQRLLEPRGVRGVVVDCPECDTSHFHDWDLLRASLEQLAGDGMMRPHEPAFAPDPLHYVTWEYCRGYADGAQASQSARG